MLSFESGKPIALVNGGDLDGEILFVDQDDDNDEDDVCCNRCSSKCFKKKCCKNCCLEKTDSTSVQLYDGKFEQVPNQEDRVVYIAAPSGSGKSTYAGQYIDKYLRLHPRAKFFVFSLLNSDHAIDYLHPHRVKIDENLLENPVDIQSEIPNDSIILFDDIDNVQDKKLQLAINKIKGQIMEIGRHKNIRIVVTSHLINPNERAAARTLLNEMNTLTVFPNSGSSYQIEYALKKYFGFSPREIESLLKTRSRWITLFKSYPQVVLSETSAILASCLKSK